MKNEETAGTGGRRLWGRRSEREGETDDCWPDRVAIMSMNPEGSRPLAGG